MTTSHAGLIVTAALMLITTPLAAQDLQQKLAAAKQNAALNQQALRSYSWLEKTEISLKGEVKGTKVDMCQGQRRADAHLRHGGQGPAADRRADLARRARQRRDADRDHGRAA